MFPFHVFGSQCGSYRVVYSPYLDMLPFHVFGSYRVVYRVVTANAAHGILHAGDS